VGRRRDDGFHPLLTWMCTVGLFDTLTLEAAPESTPAPPPQAIGRAGEPERAVGGCGIRFECDRADLPRDEGNLVVRVANALRAELLAGDAKGPVGRGGTMPSSPDGPARRKDVRPDVTPVSVMLAKRIPVGAGLGG